MTMFKMKYWMFDDAYENPRGWVWITWIKYSFYVCSWIIKVIKKIAYIYIFFPLWNFCKLGINVSINRLCSRVGWPQRSRVARSTRETSVGPPKRRVAHKGIRPLWQRQVPPRSFIWPTFRLLSSVYSYSGPTDLVKAQLYSSLGYKHCSIL